MGDFIIATVVFREQVAVAGVNFSGEMRHLLVRMEDAWLHVRSEETPSTIYSFPLSVIACVMWESES
ncbi:hypothetical protein LN042_32815 [Kitasatospora sp. RB6PN24]|uniref:hypothetical protein n=1 Tax=Kitasatospora humi TaxID=2893891 RepID=UPI001E474B4E|nr:hypothetical protein [Kitasatospora humi]MCC9311792.1 hypothetical protein [Kitasatospora humi]